MQSIQYVVGVWCVVCGVRVLMRAACVCRRQGGGIGLSGATSSSRMKRTSLAPGGGSGDESFDDVNDTTNSVE